MPSLRTFGLAGIFVIAGALPGLAQTPPPTFDELRAGARRGQTMYVTDHSGVTVKGRVAEISSHSIQLLVNDEAREWRAADVAWITDRRRHAGVGAIVGFAAGAGLGVMSVVVSDYCSHHPYERCRSDERGMVVLCGAILGGIGAGAGAAVGAATRTERVLYVAPARASSHAVSPFVARRAIGVRAQLRF